MVHSPIIPQKNGSRRKKGFTLIELLVVIGIIGVLAALVLVTTGNARLKARDARVTSTLGQMRSLASIYYYSNSNGYAGIDRCALYPSDYYCHGGIAEAMGVVKGDLIDLFGSGGGGGSSSGGYLIYGNENDYCMHAFLPSGDYPVCTDDEGVEYADSICSFSNASCVFYAPPFPDPDDPGCFYMPTSSPWPTPSGSPWPTPNPSPIATTCPIPSVYPSPTALPMPSPSPSPDP